jgi:hypothetical protein
MIAWAVNFWESAGPGRNLSREWHSISLSRNPSMTTETDLSDPRPHHA